MSERASFEAERLLITGILREPETIDAATEIVTGSSFRESALGRTFDLVADLHAAGVAVGDLTVLVPELRKAGLLEPLGGVSELGRLLRDVPDRRNTTYHAREVRRLHGCRRLAELASRIARAAETTDADPAEIAAMIEASTQSVAGDGGLRVVSLSEAMDQLADRLAADRAQDRISGVTTGLDTLDFLTGGVFPGELVVVGARTSVGKTALGMQMALDAAEAGIKTLVVSLEMAELQLAQRIVAGRLGISLIDQRTGRVTESDIAKVRRYAYESRGVPLSIVPARRAKVSEIRGTARTEQATSGLGLVVVDYLQLIAPADYRRPRYEQVTEISGSLKSLAMELDVPVVALAQLNRQGEADKPILSHLRESGAIEQDADAVWFLHRPDRKSPDSTLIVAKQRQGAVGDFPLMFDGQRCRFDEPPIEQHPNYADEFSEFAS